MFFQKDGYVLDEGFTFSKEGSSIRSGYSAFFEFEK